MLDAGKTERFEELTRWYSNLIRKEIASFPAQGGSRYDNEIKDILISFKQDLANKHPYVLQTFKIHMRKYLFGVGDFST